MTDQTLIARIEKEVRIVKYPTRQVVKTIGVLALLVSLIVSSVAFDVSVIWSLALTTLLVIGYQGVTTMKEILSMDLSVDGFDISMTDIISDLEG